MAYAYAILATGTLTLLYIGVLAIERKRSVRFANGMRTRLDRRTERAIFIWKTVDWGGFFSHVLGTTLEKILHDVVHGFLIVTRGIEKNLTRAIRALRTRISERNNGSVTEGFQLKETLHKFRKSARKQSKTGEQE